MHRASHKIWLAQCRALSAGYVLCRSPNDGDGESELVLCVPLVQLSALHTDATWTSQAMTAKPLSVLSGKDICHRDTAEG